MDEQKKRKLDKMIFRISMLPLVVGLAYMFFSAMKKHELGTDYYVVLFLCLGLHWVISDVISIICIKGFEGKTEAQIKAYRMYALMNLAGFAGLGYFAISVGTNNGLIGALIYILTLGRKRKFLDEYRGIVKPEETDEAEDTEENETEALEVSETEEATEETAIPEIEEKTEE